MKDAFGGILNLVIIAVFLVIVSGILGLIVNYTKAFKMKNAVISAIEQYEGSNSCFSDLAVGDTPCKQKISQGAKDVGYAPTTLNCPSDYSNSDNLFCYKESYNHVGDKNRASIVNGKYYTIITQVDINIPIINQITGLSIFQVHGDTRAIKED